MLNLTYSSLKCRTAAPCAARRNDAQRSSLSTVFKSRQRSASHVMGSSLQSASKIVDDILELTQGINRGANASELQRDQILQAVDALAGMQKGATRGSELDGTYKLLFSTEKETQFIVANAPRFGSEAGDIFQVIDTRTGRLQNVITFPPDGSFIVDSSIELVPDSQRANFKFNAASWTVYKRKFPVPPFGRGWFDSVYLDHRIRIAKDIRCDTLVASRDGAPRVFT